MIYERDCWSVDLPTNWRAEARKNYSIFEADVPCGALTISSAEFYMTLTDHDLRRTAYQQVNPDVQLEHVTLGV